MIGIKIVTQKDRTQLIKLKLFSHKHKLQV